MYVPQTRKNTEQSDTKLRGMGNKATRRLGEFDSKRCFFFLIVSHYSLYSVWHASRERLHFRTPGSVPNPILGLACAPIVETGFPELNISLLDYSMRIPLGTFSILLRNSGNGHKRTCDPVWSLKM